MIFQIYNTTTYKLSRKNMGIMNLILNKSGNSYWKQKKKWIINPWIYSLVNHQPDSQPLTW